MAASLEIVSTIVPAGTTPFAEADLVGHPIHHAETFSPVELQDYCRLPGDSDLCCF